MEKIAEKIKADPEFIPNRSTLVNSFVYSQIDNDEIQIEILYLPNNKAVGSENLKRQTLKVLVPHILDPFRYVLNRCIEEGLFPSIFNISLVIRVHKNGDDTDISNYRSIYLILHMAKVFERLITRRQTSYLTRFNILSLKGLQHGEPLTTLTVTK